MTPDVHLKDGKIDDFPPGSHEANIRRLVTVCPAVTSNTDCLNCGICQQRGRSAIVGFPAHGSGAKRVQKVFFLKRV